jgi:predicted nucleic acid-binding protein
MIVPAESNFVLELALRREEVAHAERILQLSESGQIELAIPACAIPETFRVLTENSRRRSRLAEDMRRELHELVRSAHYADLEKTSAGFSQTLVTSADSERSGLKSAIDRLTSCATLIALDGSIIKGITPAQAEYNLQSGDASIFVSIDTWLRTQQEGEKIFVTKDQDFSADVVSEYLSKLGCKVLSRFADASGYIGSRLGRSLQ